MAYREAGSLMVVASEDILKGTRVVPTTPDSNFPDLVCVAKATTIADPFIGIVGQDAAAGETTFVHIITNGAAVVKVKCPTVPVRTGGIIFLENSEYYTTTRGTASPNTEVAAGLIVSPLLNEAAGVGKIVEANAIFSRWIVDTNV